MNIQDKITALETAIEKATDPKIRAAYKLLKVNYENSLNPKKEEAPVNEAPLDPADITCPNCGKISKSKAGSASHQRNCKSVSL